MNEYHEGIRQFWRWFQEHQADFEALTDTADPFWDTALEELKRLDSRLWFEISEPDGDSREFIITAESHTEIFQLVDDIIVHAPKIPGWLFIALKPPMGFDFTTTYEGICFEPCTMWFLPLYSNARPDDLGLRIGVPTLTPAIEREARNAVAIILETGLGERAAAMDIQHLEVTVLPESPEAAGYIALAKLPDLIASRRQRGRNP
jgi:hypothetical protein